MRHRGCLYCQKELGAKIRTYAVSLLASRARMNLSCKTGARNYGGADFEKCLLQNKNLWQKIFNTWKDFEQKVGTNKTTLKKQKKDENG